LDFLFGKKNNSFRKQLIKNDFKQNVKSLLFKLKQAQHLLISIRFLGLLLFF
jgi:hypothetical protein